MERFGENHELLGTILVATFFFLRETMRFVDFVGNVIWLKHFFLHKTCFYDHFAPNFTFKTKKI